MEADRLKILYDHYKETYSLITVQNKLRDKLFVYLLVALTFMFLQIDTVGKVTDIGTKLTEKFLGVSLSLSPEFITGMLWFIILSLVIKYAQTLVYIEKQYDYIHTLEVSIDREVGNSKVFSREGHSYLNNYPKFSTWVWLIYTVFFPIMLLLILGYKIFTEVTLGFSTALVIDSVLCLMIFISMFLYLVLIHKKDKSKDLRSKEEVEAEQICNEICSSKS